MYIRIVYRGIGEESTILGGHKLTNEYYIGKIFFMERKEQWEKDPK